jgi:hypothetical protein
VHRAAASTGLPLFQLAQRATRDAGYELRAIATRAEISPTRFWNEYQWGHLKADPAKLMERYFDAHLYFANWGTHRLMLRIPKARVDLKAFKPYFVGRHAARLTSTREHVLLDLDSDTDRRRRAVPPRDALLDGRGGRGARSHRGQAR